MAANLVLASVALLGAAARPCGLRDIRTGFGQCNEETESRPIYYYFRGNCTDDGSTQLPDPTLLSCTIDCQPGTFLNMNVTNSNGHIATHPHCEECGAGDFSLGGGYAVTGERGGFLTENWPKAMRAWCIGRRGNHWVLNANDCRPWSPGPNGTIITSGDNKGRHQILSALSLVVVLKKDGYVSFRYQVEAEPGKDGLEFTINSVIKLRFQSNQPTWQKLTFPLKAGSHVLEWFYLKNQDGDYGTDRAELEIIEVSGTEFAELECSKCPKGTSSVPGSAACVSCGADHYASEAHYGSCKPCPNNTYSFPGAVGIDQCRTRPICAEVDYSKNFTDCNRASMTRDMYYNWTLPHICWQGVHLPPGQAGVGCEPCQPGMYDDGTGCVPCGAGHYLPATSGSQSLSCERCPEGKEAVEEVYYEYWYRWPKDFVSNGGWVLHEDYTFAGGEQQENRTAAQLTHTAFFRQDGAVNFTYQALTVGRTDPDKDLFDFFMDGVPMGRMDIRSGYHTVQFPVSAGTHTFMWNLRGTNKVLLHRVIVIGVDGGGATTCADCPAGTESTSDRAACQACAPGLVSENGMDCHPCSKDHYAMGAKACMPCPEGTENSEGKSYCSPVKVLSGKERKYNLTNLVTAFNNPGPKHTKTSQGIEIQIGQRSFAFALSRGFDTPALVSEKKVSNPDAAGVEIHVNQQYVENQTCMIETKYTYKNAGEEMKIEEIPLDTKDLGANPSKGGGLLLTLSRGDTCNVTEEYSTQVLVVCDLDVEDMYSTIDSNGDLSCSLAFTMSSRHACPICTEKDFEKSLSSCKNGKQSYSYYKTVPCIGEGPSDGEQNCNGGYSPTVIGLMSAAMAVVVLIAGGLGYYFYRLRKKYNDVHSKYVILRDGYDKNAFNLVPNHIDDDKEDDSKQEFDQVGHTGVNTLEPEV